MDRIMRWCVPDKALRRGVDWLAPSELWVGKEYTVEELNRNYSEAHGWR